MIGHRATESQSKDMLEFPDNKDPLTERIIGCAIEVHRVLGPGLLEASYEAALAIEFEAAKLRFQQQLIVPVFYKGRLLVIIGLILLSKILSY